MNNKDRKSKFKGNRLGWLSIIESNKKAPIKLDEIVGKQVNLDKFKNYKKLIP